MQVLVQAKDMKVTQALRKFVEERAERSIQKLGQKVIKTQVYLENVMRKKNDPQGAKAKVELEVAGKKSIVVSSKSFDPYQAIGKAMDAAGRRLRKVKEKRIKHHH